MFENVICGAEAFSILEVRAIRPSFSLLKGDIVYFPKNPEIRMKSSDTPGCDCQIPLVLVRINGEETFAPLKSLLGLGAILSNREEYASASPVNESLSKFFNLAQVYGYLAGCSYKVVGIQTYSNREGVSRTYPVLERCHESKK